MRTPVPRDLPGRGGVGQTGVLRQELLAMGGCQPPPSHPRFTGSPLEFALARHVWRHQPVCAGRMRELTPAPIPRPQTALPPKPPPAAHQQPEQARSRTRTAQQTEAPAGSRTACNAVPGQSTAQQRYPGPGNLSAIRTGTVQIAPSRKERQRASVRVGRARAACRAAPAPASRQAADESTKRMHASVSAITSAMPMGVRFGVVCGGFIFFHRQLPSSARSWRCILVHCFNL